MLLSSTQLHACYEAAEPHSISPPERMVSYSLDHVI